MAFNDFVNRSFEEIVCALGNVSAVMVALDGRLAKAEKRSATLAEAMQEQFLLMREQVELVGIQKSPNLYTPAGTTDVDRDNRAREISQFYTAECWRKSEVLQGWAALTSRSDIHDL